MAKEMKDHGDPLPTFEDTPPYTIALNYYREGLIAFQKKYVIKKNTLEVIAMLLIFVLFLVCAIFNPGVKGTYFLLVICLALAVMIWIAPRRQRQEFMDVVRDMEDTHYIARNDGRCVVIRTVQTEEDIQENGRIEESRIPLETAYVQEMQEFYLLCDNKTMFYILPKTALGIPFPDVYPDETAPQDAEPPQLETEDAELPQLETTPQEETNADTTAKDDPQK